jgi:hypothetical protein
VRLRTGLEVLEKKEQDERKEKISSAVQSKNNITVSVVSPNFPRQ